LSLGSQGGIGFRGPGETQLESDKRIIAKRISTIKSKLSKQSTHISNIHKARKQENLICLVGYTNAGKSTLLSSLSKEDIFSKDMLFSTLDSTTRKVFIDNDFHVLITDTVGFIRKLPHLLVESFKSTLSEVTESKLLLHVIDVSKNDVEKQIESVEEVLKEIKALDKKVIYIFNKIDKLDDVVTKKRLNEYKPSIFISALKNEGLDELKDMIKELFAEKTTQGL
jgi:GTP-binding protein HflX